MFKLNVEVNIGGRYIDENTDKWLDVWSELSRPYMEKQRKKALYEKYEKERKIKYERYMNVLMMVIAYRLNLEEKEVKKTIINREYYDSIPPFMCEWPYF
jgi:hypothetical protein